ncbi:MAG: hypothetical protein EOM23_10340, partial [Candidatus Moranbacteria bacterium]|nr:hypothetical protein [Candidatus Moranbacteria bacterium]
MTKDHSLIVLDPYDFNIKTICIDKLIGNEFLPTIKEMPYFKNNLKFISILDYISKENVVIKNGKIYIKDSKNYMVQNALQEKISLDENFSYFLGVF